MKKNTVIWILKQIRPHIPALILLVLASGANALFGGLFALGSRAVIDGAVAGDSGLFLKACLQQLGIIGGILLTLTLSRHLRDKLHADLERHWKKRLLHGLLHGEYAAVSGFHSAELLNRLNNDVRILNRGILDVLPNVAALVPRLIAALVVLTALEPLFSLVICAAGGVVILTTGLVRRRLKGRHRQVS